MSTADSHDPQLAAVTNWLLRKKPALGEIDLDLDLIESRVIDSLGFLDFVFFLEELTGRELKTDAQSVKAFRTLRSIRDQVLTGAAADV
jgi:acyl carrier protein